MQNIWSGICIDHTLVFPNLDKECISNLRNIFKIVKMWNKVVCLSLFHIPAHLCCFILCFKASKNGISDFIRSYVKQRPSHSKCSHLSSAKFPVRQKKQSCKDRNCINIKNVQKIPLAVKLQSSSRCRCMQSWKITSQIAKFFNSVWNIYWNCI